MNFGFSNNQKLEFEEEGMEDCIFCKIAFGEIQGLRIYENDKTQSKTQI